MLGNIGGIGVFLWDTDSVINHQVPGLSAGASGVSNLTFAQLVNGTGSLQAAGLAVGSLVQTL